MAVPHYTYLVLKMPGPKGIITVKESFEVSDLCDREFHKMAQNFGMIANYAEKAKSTTTKGVNVTTHFCKPGKLVVTLSCVKFGANKNFISFVA
jgi:hypothetical protein